MTDAAEHCQRPWWKRPPVWFIGIAAVLILLAVVIVGTERPAPMPYSTFFGQLEAGNVASVTFQGTQVEGRFKRPLDGTLSTGTTQRDSFSTHVPDVGDPTLMPELRKQHVAIDVSVQSAWTWLLGRVPIPIVIVIGAIIVAGIVRLVRGGKPQSGSAMSMHPMHGMMGLVSGLFGKQQTAARHRVAATSRKVASVPDSEVRKPSRHPLMRTSESKGHWQIYDFSAGFGFGSS